MNTSPTDGYRPHTQDRAPIGPGEDTLRLIARLPAPDGFADRVRAGLRAAPERGSILMVRGSLRPPGGWMYSGLVRGLAAAAIVCVVAGGGWRIYSHVKPTVKLVVMPAPVSPGGNGFSQAGGRRVPETLDGPVLNHPVATPPELNVVDKAPAESKAAAGTTIPKKKKTVRIPARTAQ